MGKVSYEREQHDSDPTVNVQDKEEETMERWRENSKRCMLFRRWRTEEGGAGGIVSGDGETIGREGGWMEGGKRAREGEEEEGRGA